MRQAGRYKVYRRVLSDTIPLAQEADCMAAENAGNSSCMDWSPYMQLGLPYMQLGYLHTRLAYGTMRRLNVKNRLFQIITELTDS